MYWVIFALLFCLILQNKVVNKYKLTTFLPHERFLLNFNLRTSKKRNNYFSLLIHDLKTPVYAQIRTLKLMLSGTFGNFTNEQTKIIKEMLNSEMYMADIITNILTEHKYDCTALKLVNSNFDISSALNNVYESAKILAEEKNQILQINYRCSSLYAYGDKLQITRVMTNLISNAIKYGYPNSTIVVNLENDNGNISFCVKDNGASIPKEKLRRIFDKFTGGMNHYNSASTGLGLYLSKKIIEMHKGKIYAKSVNGINEFGFKLTANKLNNNQTKNNILTNPIHK